MLHIASSLTRLMSATILLHLVLLGLGQHAAAQNMAFMPGDAFFVFQLRDSFVRELPDDGGTVELRYEVPMVGFGGFAGFDRLKLDGVTPAFVSHLRRVYEHHRLYAPKTVMIEVLEDGTRNEIEQNAPIAFVYNKDVDWSRQRIGLKYNETWMHLPAEASSGPARRLFSVEEAYNVAEVYVPLFRSYDAVVEDWRYASEFDRLHVDVPSDVGWGRSDREPVKKPVVARCNDVQIIVTARNAMKGYYRKNPVVMFYQVTSSEVNQLEWRVEEGVVNVQSKALPQE